MKPETHPDYHTVMFIDSATGTEWTTRSTITSKETREIDGEDVPVVRLDISSVSHPFWTGTMRELDADGKIERYRKRYGKKAAKVSEAAPSDDADAASTETAETPEAADSSDSGDAATS
jgi:large subunit ribosomal protein L31